MARHYELVGCYYNQYAQEKYQNEVSIKIKGVSFKKLEDIDLFTTSMTYSSFLEQLSEEERKNNLFSIRVTNSKDASSYYIKTIFDDEKLNQAIKEIQKKNVMITNGRRTFSILPYYHPIVYETFLPIKKALEEKDKNALANLLSLNSNYGYKLSQFIDTFYEEGEEVRVLDELRTEFCHYSVFRSIYTYHPKKKKQTSTCRNINIRNHPTFTKNMNLQKDERTISQKINDYNQMMQDINQIGDKEEFLDQEEMIQMGYDVREYHL